MRLFFKQLFNGSIAILSISGFIIALFFLLLHIPNLQFHYNGDSHFIRIFRIMTIYPLSILTNTQYSSSTFFTGFFLYVGTALFVHNVFVAVIFTHGVYLAVTIMGLEYFVRTEYGYTSAFLFFRLLLYALIYSLPYVLAPTNTVDFRFSYILATHGAIYWTLGLLGGLFFSKIQTFWKNIALFVLSFIVTLSGSMVYVVFFFSFFITYAVWVCGQIHVSTLLHDIKIQIKNHLVVFHPYTVSIYIVFFAWLVARLLGKIYLIPAYGASYGVPYQGMWSLHNWPISLMILFLCVLFGINGYLYRKERGVWPIVFFLISMIVTFVVLRFWHRYNYWYAFPLYYYIYLPVGLILLFAKLLRYISYPHWVRIVNYGALTVFAGMALITVTTRNMWIHSQWVSNLPKKLHSYTEFVHLAQCFPEKKNIAVFASYWIFPLQDFTNYRIQTVNRNGYSKMVMSNILSYTRIGERVIPRYYFRITDDNQLRAVFENAIQHNFPPSKQYTCAGKHIYYFSSAQYSDYQMRVLFSRLLRARTYTRDYVYRAMPSIIISRLESQPYLIDSAYDLALGIVWHPNHTLSVEGIQNATLFTTTHYRVARGMYQAVVTVKGLSLNDVQNRITSQFQFWIVPAFFHKPFILWHTHFIKRTISPAITYRQITHDTVTVTMSMNVPYNGSFLGMTVLGKKGQPYIITHVVIKRLSKANEDFSF